MELKGKTALVTGGGIRLGRAFALALAQEGVNLVVHYNESSAPADETVQLAADHGVKAVALASDFTDISAVQSLFLRSREYFEHIDILINSAGIYLKSTGLETDLKTWDSQFRINLQTPFLLTQAFAKQLPKSKPGRVLNIADAQINRPQPSYFAYHLTKIALVEMTRLFAIELAPNITVNALGLGIMLPLAGKEDVDLKAYAKENIPLNRTGSPEIAVENALHFIKSDFTTGAFLRVDGGQYL
jgi:glucose 1-dehydrogenase